MNKTLIFGYGYCAKFLMKMMQNQEFFATSRQNFTQMRNLINFADDEAIKNLLPEISTILISTPPENSADPALTKLLQMKKYCKNLRKMIYLSSSSVYGDHAGNWVDENSQTKAISGNGLERLMIEKEFSEFCHDVGVGNLIFRLTGIYGPERNVIERMRNGQLPALPTTGQFFSRIHIYDIVNVLEKAILQDVESGIYNLSDNLPCEYIDLLKFAANLLGLEFSETHQQKSGKFTDNKKVSNAKMKKTFGEDLIFPSYVEGLKSLVQGC